MPVAAERVGGSLREFAHATEEKPALWDRFGGAEQRFLSAVHAVILEVANAGDVGLLGCWPVVLLAGIGHAIRIRIVASEAIRAARLPSQQGLTRSGDLDGIRRADRERAARLKFVHHVDAEDLSLYDLTINTDRMSVDTATRLLREAATDARFRPTTDSRKELSDRSIAAHAGAALAADPRMRGARLDVTCIGGCLLLVGRVDREAQREAAQEIVQTIPGVTHVLNEVGGASAGRHRTAPWRSAPPR
jgi:cytidylate kinase